MTNTLSARQKGKTHQPSEFRSIGETVCMPCAAERLKWRLAVFHKLQQLLYVGESRLSLLPPPGVRFRCIIPGKERHAFYIYIITCISPPSIILISLSRTFFFFFFPTSLQQYIYRGNYNYD